jgi:putative DNA methylase
MPSKVIPFSLKTVPALIEKLLPVQKLSVDVYKERMAGAGQTLTALGSYWKGRKPLVLNRACVLGALLPATEDSAKDLEIFELLMSMDDVSQSKRIGLPKPAYILRSTNLSNVWDYFQVVPDSAKSVLPDTAPFDIDQYSVEGPNGKARTPKITWRDNLSVDERHAVAANMLTGLAYKEVASNALRAEEIHDLVHTHIWDRVNQHLGTSAHNYPELVEQLGIMRFGQRPIVADTFSGSGQIPFEAARLGCDVYASDLNPIACLLTWSAFNIAGASAERRDEIAREQAGAVKRAKAVIDELGVESDGNGWRGKVYLYCLEVTCPTSGWRVPILQSRVVSVGYRVIAELVPDHANKRYEIKLRQGASDEELRAAEVGTITRNSSRGGAYITHRINGVLHRNAISSIRGDMVTPNGEIRRNNLRAWEKEDLVFRETDLLSERLYAIQWIDDTEASRPKSEFREVTAEDIRREQRVLEYVRLNMADWMRRGLMPEMKIEPGAPPRYQGRSLIVERGWTYWHHAFNPRQLLLNATLLSCCRTPESLSMTMRGFDVNSRLSVWHRSDGGGGSVQKVFMNQALNPLYDYGSRGLVYLAPFISSLGSHAPVIGRHEVMNCRSADFRKNANIFITDPPYGDAVKYEELLDFFIAWVRKNNFDCIKDWVWDGRRALAIKGEDHEFKVAMVDAYRNMTNYMPDNGIQIVMFTHQDNAIWADMANIVWASGLRVTAAWYVVTETDSALRDGQYVKGTILLVLRKRVGNEETFRDEIAYELEDEVKRQVEMLTGLNAEAKNLYHGGNLFEDADIQMAGYAAALRVLTRYSVIDGISMPQEAMRPRIKGQKTMVDELIDFAVTKANEFLIPQGIDRATWTKLNGSERFYLKIVEAEAGGAVTKAACDNYAKAFKVRDYGDLFEQVKANNVRAKSAQAFGKRSLSSGDEFGSSLVRGLLYGIYLLSDGKTKSEDVLAQLRELIPNYYDRREQMKVLTQFMHKMTSKTRPEESTRAMVMRDLVHNERA